MSGTPPSASVVETVAESVGTTGADPNTFSWTCPTVDFDGPVYSYMASNPSLHIVALLMKPAVHSDRQPRSTRVLVPVYCRFDRLMSQAPG
jgi:hypothetical protein